MYTSHTILQDQQTISFKLFFNKNCIVSMNKRIESSESFKGADSKERLVRESDITIVRRERDSRETESTGAHSSSSSSSSTERFNPLFLQQYLLFIH